MLVILAVSNERRVGFGPVLLFPLTMYIHEPSALNVMSWGSYAVGMRPATVFAFLPFSGMTATAFAPLFTAYSVSPSGASVTAKVAAPVYFRLGSTPAGARASIFVMTLLVDVSMTATWSALSCATYSVDCAVSRVIPRALPSSLMRE